MHWYGQLLLRLWPRPHVPHHQHYKPRQRRTKEPNFDPLIFREAHDAINPAHGSHSRSGTVKPQGGMWESREGIVATKIL